MLLHALHWKFKGQSCLWTVTCQLVAPGPCRILNSGLSLSHTLGFSATAAACLVVSTLVAAVERLHKTGDEARRQAAQETLERSLQLTRAIEEQLANINANVSDKPQLGVDSQGNVCVQAACGVGHTSPASTAAGGKDKNAFARAYLEALGLVSIESPSESNGTQLWHCNDSKDVSQQLPSHCQLVKVSAHQTPAVNVCMMCLERGVGDGIRQQGLSVAGVRGGCKDEGEAGNC